MLNTENTGNEGLLGSEEFCPACEQIASRRIERRQETLSVRGESLTVDARVAVCTACGEDVEDEQLDNDTLGRAYELQAIRVRRLLNDLDTQYGPVPDDIRQEVDTLPWID